MTQQIVAVEAESANIAGALVYWSLSGYVDLQDLAEALTAEGLDAERLLPTAPSADVVLLRAMQQAVHERRQLVRPLGKRGAYSFVQERVTREDGAADESLAWGELVRGTTTKDDSVTTVVTATQPAGEAIAAEIRSHLELFRDLLITTDYSAWLLWYLFSQVKAVGLRDRGGFYFVPRDQLPAWKRIVSVTKKVSSHKTYEIPAMRTEDAVEAILAAVRGEAETQLQELEEYLSGEKVSTRGLNAAERKLKALREKTEHYAQLLGVALPDLAEKSLILLGAIGAARTARDNA